MAGALDTTEPRARASRIDGALTTWLDRIRGEYAESPGLGLTLAEARRFWGLDDAVTRAVFAALVDAGFLKQTRLGTYLRATVH